MRYLIAILLFIPACFVEIEDTGITSMDASEGVETFCCWDCGYYNCCMIKDIDGNARRYDSPNESCYNTLTRLIEDENKALDYHICWEFQHSDCS